MSFEKDALVLEKNRALAATFLLISVLLGIAGIAQVMLHRGPPIGLYVLSIPLGLWARAKNDNWRAKQRNARVRANARGVMVDGVEVVASKDIVHALVQPRPGKKPTVRLRDKKRRVLFELEVEDEAEGVAFLQAIGHDASVKKASFVTMSPLLATQARAGLVIFGIIAATVGMLVALFSFHVAPWLTMAAFIVGLIPLFAAVRSADVEVGADGISTKWNGRRRFIPFDDVKSVDTTTVDVVELVLTSGKTVPLRTGGNSGWSGKERAALLRDALARRITEAMDAHRARIGPRELAAQLARGDRDEAKWIEDLKKLREGEGGYRAAAVREEDLWRVVEDPGAHEEARAAAAVLLRDVEGAKPRLRIAADAVASPKLRVALEAEEEEEAEEALKAYLKR